MTQHETPDELDEYFDRDIVEPEEYAEFWSRWHRASSGERREIMEELDLRIEEREGQHREAEEPIEAPPPTTSRVMAERQAAALGGYVVRRDARGRFNARGRTYQVIIPKRKRG